MHNSLLHSWLHNVNAIYLQYKIEEKGSNEKSYTEAKSQPYIVSICNPIYENIVDMARRD